MYKLFFFVVLVLLIVGCGMIPDRPPLLPSTPEEVQTRDMTSPEGKSLVYFSYGRIYPWGFPEVSLNGAGSPINQGMYVVWEVPPGTYLMTFTLPGRNFYQEIVTGLISCQPNQVAYYYLYRYTTWIGVWGPEEDVFRFVRASDSRGRKNVQTSSLVSWFRDGEQVYYNERVLENMRKSIILPGDKESTK